MYGQVFDARIYAMKLIVAKKTITSKTVQNEQDDTTRLLKHHRKQDFQRNEESNYQKQFPTTIS